MCGILAVLSRSSPITTDYAPLLERIRHRGPDDSGAETLTLECDATQRERRAWLGHTRLSILDLSPRGRQPMASADGAIAIVFNGEIYNYVELRDELRRTGSTFATTTDTEVLIEAWRHWGVSALNRLKGMFAFLVVDRREGTATLVRDHFGIKPLYYAESAGSVGVCSEVLPLIATGHAQHTLNADVAFEYLRFGATRENARTLLRDVQCVPPAHVVEFDFRSGTMGEPRCYWALRTETRAVSFADAVHECRERFVENVRLHLRSDVPVGAALSGGIDSSAIVCVMRKIEPDLDLKTFSYIASEPAQSEERWVDMVHRQVGGACHKIRPSAHGLIDDLRALVRCQGEPFASASMYAQHRVFERARAEGVPVTLDGQGADELLGGYWPYAGTYVAERLRNADVVGALRLMRGIARDGGVRKMVGVLGEAVLSGSVRRLARRALGRSVFPDYLNADWFASQQVDYRSIAESMIGHHPGLQEHLVATVQRGSLPNLLRYADRNSMAFSVESRVPFLTHDFAEFVLALPPSFIISDTGVRKHVFREAMRGILPEPIRTRRDKIGFFADDELWLRKNRAECDAILSSIDSPAIDRNKLRTYVGKFWAGDRQRTPLVWRALVFALWSDEISRVTAHA